jgi:hypothetical protein
MKEAAWGAEKDIAEWSFVPRQMAFHLWVVEEVSVWRRRIGDVGIWVPFGWSGEAVEALGACGSEDGGQGQEGYEPG